MIIPSIDLMGGSAIQLVGGKGKGVVSLEPFFAAAKFSLAGRMAVIDLDAAFNKGDNSEIVKELVSKYRCNVGGGIRTVDEAMDWLQSGADKVILGTAATPEILKQLPRDKVIAALDIKNDVVMVDGWRKSTDHVIENRILRLKDYVDEFLVTFIECEGRMDGTRLERALELSALAQPARLIIAGGITSEMEINYLDKFNMDAQVGMALYTGGLHLADAIGAPLTRNSIATVEGLWPTVICDESGVALGLAYSSKESLRQAVDNLRGVYYSRSRNSIWEKGKTSGNIQHLRRIDLDCDRDTLRFVVSQEGRGFCHNDTRSCWGDDIGLGGIYRHLEERVVGSAAGSYACKLIRDPDLLKAKLEEEATELAEAKSEEEIIWEAADVLFFTMMHMLRAGITIPDVERELERRRRIVKGKK